MSKLYFTESGNVVETLCEELADYRRARKILNLPGTHQGASLYILARSYPENKLPLRITVNGTELTSLPPSSPDIYLWHEVPVPPSLLVSGANVFEFWADSPAMNSWSLGLENGHCDPKSFLSTDSGQTWRNEKMGFLNVSRGEYVVRVRLAEGEDPAPPAMAWENPATPRLERLRKKLPESLRKPAPWLERVRALLTWVSTSWIYRCGAPVYAPWDAETILAWGKAERGHDGREPIVMCVHYAVTMASFCNALGIPARCAIYTGSINGCNGHFTNEVWVEELGKWVFIDPHLDAILFRDQKPLSVKEIQQSGSDLSDLIAWGPGFTFQFPHPVVTDGVKRNYLTGICFTHRSLWPRMDFLSHPEMLPAGHGTTSYCETALVWEKGDLYQGFGMFPYFGDEDYFNAAPRDYPGHL